MWLFDLFKKKSAPKTEHAETNSLANASKIDRLWERWKRNGVPSPYRELMTYYHDMEIEVNKVGGGHYQYFKRLNDISIIEGFVNAYDTLMPNSGPTCVLHDAVRLYKKYNGIDEKELEYVMGEEDMMYLGDHDDILAFIEEYAEKVEY